MRGHLGPVNVVGNVEMEALYQAQTDLRFDERFMNVWFKKIGKLVFPKRIFKEVTRIICPRTG